MRIHLQDSSGAYHMGDTWKLEDGMTEEEAAEIMDDLFQRLFQAKFFSMEISGRTTYFNPAHIISIVAI